MYPLVILCGGKAKRLGSLARDIPKSLIEISNKPFLTYILQNYIDQGVKDIYFCVGHLSNKFEEYLNSNTWPNINFYTSYDDEIFNGTGGAIKKVSKTISGPFFVAYGDSYLNINLKKVIENYKINSGPLMTIYKNDGQFDNSNCKILNNRVIYSKTKQISEANFIDYGLSIFREENFKNFPDSFDLSEIQQAYSEDGQLQHFEVMKRFYEIGSVDGLQEFNEHIKKFQ